jgi:hypothetical protein
MHQNANPKSVSASRSPLRRNNQHVAKCFHALLATLANEILFLISLLFYALTFILYLFSFASIDSRSDIGLANPM